MHGPEPAIPNIAVTGNPVRAATTDNPLFDAHLGSLDDFLRNQRGWGATTGIDAAVVESLVARLLRASP